MLTHRYISLAVSLLLVATVAQAQTEIGMNVGISFYEGDLGAPTPIERLAIAKTSFGAYSRFDISDRLAFRLFVQSSKVQGSDANRPGSMTRNLSFESDIYELGFMTEIYPFGTYQSFAPYFQAGVSVYRFNPTTEYNGRIEELQPLGTEGQGLPGFAPKYGLTRMAVPVGIGFRHQFGQNWIVGMQGAARMLFFDHLDDVSGNYVNYNTLRSGEDLEGSTGNGSLAAALGDRTGEFLGQEPRDIPSGTRRGDPTDNDWFYTATVTVGYRLGSGLFSAGKRRGSGASRYNKCYSF